VRIAITTAFIWLFSLAAFAADMVTIVPVSGPTITDVLLRDWSADRISVGVEAPRDLPVDDVLSVQFARTATPLTGGDSLVVLTNGDRLVVRPVGVFEDVLTATWQRNATRPPLKLPLESVASIIFDLPTSQSDRLRLFGDLKTLPAGADIVLLSNLDRLQGDFERLDATSIHLKTPNGLQKIDRNRVRALRMNPELTDAPRIAGRRFVLTLADGSQITAQRVAVSGNELKCTTFSKLEFVLPSSSLVSCHTYGVVAMPLSEREPSKVEFVPFLSAQWSLQKNANCLRGPLTIRGVEYGSGLGMHSRMLVTYTLQGNEREFRSTVGVDDCANGSGSVIFAVEVDGRRVWESAEITGSSPALAIPPVKLTGARQLTLLVDYGKNADVLDYADWCDATLVLERH
jgi:hypothetical protein